MKKTIRTMQGKKIDFEELALRNEAVRAVGNMNVNAAGDDLDKANNKVDRTRRNNKAYRRQIQKKVFDMPVMASKADAEIYAAKMAREYKETASKVVEPTVDSTELFDEVKTVGKAVIQTAPDMPKGKPKEVKKNEVSDELLQEVLKRSSSGGLAGAIAKAKKVNHGPIKSPREQLRAEDGVKKI